MDGTALIAGIEIFLRNEELTARDRIITSIFQISNPLIQRVGLDESLRSILINAEKALGFSASSPFSMNDDKVHLDCRMVTGVGEENKKDYSKPFHLIHYDCIEMRALMHF
ncbi:MAG: hypothetical protein NTV99_11110 [Deltaproteobacteria bacterium]|nr:hypothetical protein [Deltaproteobacteria bacterium]